MKSKRSAVSYRRKSKTIRPNPFFIIVCEGKVTEPEYFKKFPYYYKVGGLSPEGMHYSHKPVHIEAEAGQHAQVVKNAVRILREMNKTFGTIEKKDVWCVFDCDEKPDSLTEAVQMATAQGFNPIYTIQRFELWFVLHFQHLSTAINPKDYDKKTSKYCGINYEHGTLGMYELLEARQQIAISNAKQLWAEKERNGNRFEDPITNVHLLVEALNQAYTNLKNKFSS